MYSGLSFIQRTFYGDPLGWFMMCPKPKPWTNGWLLFALGIGMHQFRVCELCGGAICDGCQCILGASVFLVFLLLLPDFNPLGCANIAFLQERADITGKHNHFLKSAAYFCTIGHTDTDE